jgi:hypothetical protein
MVLDGTLDFTGNVTGHNPGDAAAYPIDVRQGVDAGAQDVFSRFLALCAQAGPSACAFAAGGNLPAKWATLLARAQAGKLSYQNLMTMAFYDLEAPIADWPSLASYLQTLYTTTAAGRGLAAGPAARLAGLAAAARRTAAYTGNGQDAYYAIQCADSLVPTQTSVYHNLAISEDAAVPGFGRMAVYDMMPCASWPYPHSDAYDGPWNLSRTTILVINAQHDPFTPLAGAQAGVSELGNARLLTVAGDGHTSMYVEPSVCREAARLAYLVSGLLPPAGQVCPVDKLPFGLP